MSTRLGPAKKLEVFADHATAIFDRIDLWPRTWPRTWEPRRVANSG